MKRNSVGWFEIPVENMDRALAFYEKVFNIKLSRNTLDEFDMAWFPGEGEAPGASGSLVMHKNSYTPSLDGVLIYFTSLSGDLADELSRVKDAGGKVVLEKRLISDEVGYMGLFHDTEGNRIALHSTK